MTAPLLRTTDPCVVHPTHTPGSHMNEHHHVWPLGRGGPDVPANIIVVCPTGHYNIHHLLDQYIAHRGDLPWSLRMTFSTRERSFALLGYQRLTQGHL